MAVMQKWWASCVGVCIVGMLLGACNTAPPEARQTHESSPPTLAVVTTLEALQKQPAVALDTALVRVGIEANHAPANSGILVYALFDGETPTRKPARLADDKWLGSLRVRINTPDSKAESLMVLEKGVQYHHAPAKGNTTPVYATAIPVGRRGPVHVTVLADDRVIATATITVDATDVPPWMPLQLEAGQEGPEVVTVMPRHVVPQWAGEWPVLVQKQLPTCVPAKPHPDMVLSSENGQLALRATSPIQRDLDHYMVRAWVNGKPWEPRMRHTTRELRPKQAATHVGPVMIPLPLDIKSMEGVKSGDQLQLQLLYSAEGWQVPPGAQQKEALPEAKALRPLDVPPVLLSNTLRLRVP